ncbi:MAG: mannose-6-phosphate isomerase, class I [Limosilactobacillus sp.]|uniref:mannose-6-phosphate isomerase, class I n=1 Tax=Limosilactobacillus sp. TaxID=2773925 RepID=UPI0026F754D4|nr:mannose-6-phosphate isomerase, class I [Limosilactobacillus sp.]
MTEPLFLKPVFHEKIWGGRHLETDFGYDIPAGTIGECWAISGHPHGPNLIENGEYAGQLLPDVYAQHPEVFGNPKSKVFPLLTKILDANASLSVQVHPDDAYAEEHEHELGKTECWYVIHADEGAYLTYGHTAKTRDELRNLVDNHEWDKLFSKKQVKTGDFVYVPSGTIHALNKGIVVLETQQSSDTTYRIYDYDRVDQKTGKKRDLHLKQSIDVTNVPFQEPVLHSTSTKVGDSTVTTLITQPDSPFFSVYKWQVNGQLTREHEHGPYTLISIIDGQGTLTANNKTYDLTKGTHLIIPADIDSWTLDGQMLVIASESAE